MNEECSLRGLYMRATKMGKDGVSRWHVFKGDRFRTGVQNLWVLMPDDLRWN